jgi:hypothetical protein
VKGVVSISGFTPMRTDTASKGTGGIARYSEVHPMMPRLGFFIGQEARLPFDFDEPLALAASRPVLLIAPIHDRYARVADVRAEVQPITGVTLETPLDINRFDRKFQSRVLDWLAEQSR